MFKESKVMKELREIRGKNYEATKEMSTEEMLDYFRKKAKKIEIRIKKK